jgi:hypothetical protein
MEKEIKSDNIKSNKASADNEFKDEHLELDEVTEGKTTVKLINEEKTFRAFYNPAQVNNLKIKEYIRNLIGTSQ